MARPRFSPQAQDLVVSALLAALGLFEVWLPMESVFGAGSPAVSSVGIVAVAALLSQRRARPWVAVAALLVWPVLGLLTGGQLQVLFLGQLVPTYVLAYSMARHAPGALRWLAALLIAAYLALADLALPDLRSPGELIFHWATVALAYLIGRGLRASEEKAVAAAVAAEQADAASRERSAAAVAEERARIARELHDIVTHAVGVMVVQAGAAEQVVDENPEFVRRALGAIRTSGTGAMSEMRRMVQMLRVPDPVAALTPLPGLEALPELVAAVRDAGLEVRVTRTGRHVPLGGGLDLAAYRIVQEALSNVRRHSAATSADVGIHFGDDLRIRVSDPGPALPGGAAPGHGLVGIRERVSLFGGTLTVHDEDGFAVEAVLPLEGP